MVGVSSISVAESFVGQSLDSEELARNQFPSQALENSFYRRAIADLAEAIRLDPSFSEALRQRSLVYGLLGMNQEAEQDLSRAEDLELAGPWDETEIPSPITPSP